MILNKDAESLNRHLLFEFFILSLRSHHWLVGTKEFFI